MKSITRSLIVILIAASFLLSACAQAPKPAEKIKPAQLEDIDGSEFKRVILTEKAAERIDIQTTLVSEMPVERQLTLGGEVVEPMSTRAIAASPTTAKTWVRVHVEENDFADIDKDELALVLPLRSDAGFISLSASSVELDDNDDIEDIDEEGSVFLEIEDEDSGLTVGQRVLVKLSLLGSGGQQKVVPYAAVIYGLNGETWVYTNPEPLVFIRAPIVISHIEGDQAFLTEGPETGTSVVIVGVAELYGAETGVSK